jgi:hypothetical protein
MTPEERTNILDQHKEVYDGFVTSYGQQINQQPLYVQDYANDKGGLVVNNKGNVKLYSNMNINESYGEEYEEEEEFDFTDKIADGDDDLVHGTVDDEFEDINLFGLEEKLDEEDIEPIQEQVNKTLDMFKRFKNY